MSLHDRYMKVVRGELIAGAHMPAKDIEVASGVLSWLIDFIAQPHHLMQRPGNNKAVCPFMPHVLDSKSGSLSIAVENGVDGSLPDDIVHLMREKYLPLMAKGYSDPLARSSVFRSFVVIFPEIPTAREHLLSDCQRDLKDTAVTLRLMIGEAYPTCKVGSAYREDFKIMRSPSPLLALRGMQIYDLPFLLTTKHFPSYDRFFGKTFANGLPSGSSAEERCLHARYWEAKQRFANLPCIAP
jgi:hypothetical protein